MKEISIAAALALALASGPLAAQTRSEIPVGQDVAIEVAQAKPDALTEGEIRRVDKEAKKLTIKHGPIANLDMPPMTMVFEVKDPKLLDQVKAGDKVKFRAENNGGRYVVTRIEK